MMKEAPYVTLGCSTQEGWPTWASECSQGQNPKCKVQIKCSDRVLSKSTRWTISSCCEILILSPGLWLGLHSLEIADSLIMSGATLSVAWLHQSPVTRGRCWHMGSMLLLHRSGTPSFPGYNSYHTSSAGLHWSGQGDRASFSCSQHRGQAFWCS